MNAIQVRGVYICGKTEKKYSILSTALLYSYRYLQYTCCVPAQLALRCTSIQ